MSLLSPASLERLQNRKNLLAFSAGGDSTALFFLLKAAHIPFDIALVNYQTRAQSDVEAAYALMLAQRYRKRCYLKTTKLETKNFEHRARRLRYAFFEEIIARFGYENLITAHHLNDKTEWFLMQFAKGAGTVEMTGFDEIETRAGYQLVRPLIYTPKAALTDYLQKEKIRYFVDESNTSTHFLRNYFRKTFADKLVEAYASGIQKSFRYLHEDKKRLFDPDIYTVGALQIAPRSGDALHDMRLIDKMLKTRGYLLSAAQKREILRQQEGIVGGKFVVALTTDAIFVAPVCRAVMPKSFKEACRRAKIPPKIRPCLFVEGIDPFSLPLPACDRPET